MEREGNLTMIATEQIPQLYGHDVTDPNGLKIGTLGALWTDESGTPTWASVRTGLFGLKESLVPLHEAEVEGDHVRVPYAKDQVKDAPNVDASADEPLEGDEIARLYQHYHLGSTTERTGYHDAGHEDAGGFGDRTAGVQEQTWGEQRQGFGDAEQRQGFRGDEQRQSFGDDAMTRSEERLDVGTETREAARARLRKYVVTENVQTTVPVSHEEVRLEREPITDANRDAAFSGSDLSESEHEVTLRAEEPVVRKDTVPVERVRLGTETMTEERPIDEDVRKERIESDLPDRGNRTL
jgi:uncharacterized protein (TIGR02271 family)